MDNAEKFNEWMKSKVQSYYYSNNLEMLNAFNTMTDKDGNGLCRTIEELHQYLEENKVNDYHLSKYQIMTDEERTALLNQLMSDYEQP